MFKKSEIEVCTTQYEFAHGRLPKGRGLWMFAFVGKEAKPFEFNGSYAEAKKAAIAEAQRRNTPVVYVMS